MQLYYFLAVVVSLSCGSLPPLDIDPSRAILATIGMVIAWIVLCHVGARVIAIQVVADDLDPATGAHWLDKQLDAFRYLGIAVAVLCLGGFGLARVLDTLPILEHSMFLQALVLLAPAVAMTAGTWSAEHLYGMVCGYVDRGIGNHVRNVWLAFRGGMAWLVVPILILLAGGDLLSMIALDAKTASVITALMIALFVPLGLPWLVRHLFKTSRFDTETENWVCDLMSAAGLGRTKVVRWETGNRSFNAMVAGFTPPARTLLVSDRLADELPREQMAMVVLHEVAHLRRRHVPIRMLSILPAWAAAAAVTRIGNEAPWAVAVGSLIGILLTMLILRIVAYRTEFDADVVACRMAEKIGGHIQAVPATYDQAADVLADALLRVTGEHPAAQKATWLHPGVADRVASIRRHRSAPTTSSASAGTIANPA